MALPDTAVRQAKPSGKNYTLKDAGGFALFVGPKGAKQWYASRPAARATLSQIDRHFGKDILPWLGDLPIVDVSRQHVLEVLRKIERRKAMTTAEKCRAWLNQLFRCAMVEKGLVANPGADLDIVALPKPKVRHNSHLRMDELPAFLRKLGTFGGIAGLGGSVGLLGRRSAAAGFTDACGAAGAGDDCSVFEDLVCAAP